jgi:hypothetical protein
MYTQDQTGSAPSEAFTAVTADGADFGASVDVDDGRAIVGAPGINKAFIYYGVAAGGDPKLATTYEGLTGKFADGSDERHCLRFGTSVAIDGDVAAVGADESAQKDDDSDSRSGSAYIIEKSIDLSVAVRPDEVSVHKGDNAEFTLTVVNHDPALTAHHVTIAHMVGNGIVESIVPIGDDFVSSSADCDVIPGQVSCDLGTLGPEMSREPSVVVQVVLGSDFQATFGVHAYEADQDENNNEDISDVHSSIKPQESDPPPDSGGGGGALGFFWLLLLAGAWLKRRQP